MAGRILIDQSEKIISLEKDLIKKGENHSNTDLSTEDDLDAFYSRSEKRHRNQRADYDHKFKIIIHPFNLYKISLVILLIFIITRYLGLFFEIGILITISHDAWTFLTYAGTALITHIITKYIDKHYKD